MFFPYWLFYDTAFNWLVLAVDQSVYVLCVFLGMALLFCFFLNIFFGRTLLSGSSDGLMRTIGLVSMLD